jgi:hypothetical protein
VAGFKVSAEEKLIRGKGPNVFYFTRETQEFHMGCMTYLNMGTICHPTNVCVGHTGQLLAVWFQQLGHNLMVDLL